MCILNPYGYVYFVENWAGMLIFLHFKPSVNVLCTSVYLFDSGFGEYGTQGCNVPHLMYNITKRSDLHFTIHLFPFPLNFTVVLHTL